jgi:hypothetical protein
VLAEDQDLHNTLDEAIHRRMFDIYQGDVDEPARQSLLGGVNTAMDIESITLATIQHRVESGQHITGQGLIKSQRVPFVFAMQPLAQLDLLNNALFDYAWLESNDGSSVDTKLKVLRPEVAEMSPAQGLRLTAELPEAPRYSSFLNEPGIGCPITIVKHFIRDMHALAAQTCVQAGIIPVAEA